MSRQLSLILPAHPYNAGHSKAGYSCALARKPHRDRILEQQLRIALAPHTCPFFTSPSFPAQAGAFIDNPGFYISRINILAANVAKQGGDERIIRSAAELAWRGHAGGIRKDQRHSYFFHPLEVAEGLFKKGLSDVEIAAGLLHDMFEDAFLDEKPVDDNLLGAKLNHIPSKKKGRILVLVRGVTELGKARDWKGAGPNLTEIHKEFINQGSRDLGIILIRLEDRLNNMRTLEYLPKDTQEEKSKETLRLYVSLADALGMWDVKRELEDLCFKYLGAQIFRDAEGIYDMLVVKREELREKSQAKVSQIARIIEDKLRQTDLRIRIKIEQRKIYELRQRMEKRDIPLEQLSASDIWRINVIIPEQADCFSIKGKLSEVFGGEVDRESIERIHQLSANGHRFLHFYINTRALGHLLIQIRDETMWENYHHGILSRVKGKPEWHQEDTTWLTGMSKALQSTGDIHQRDADEIISAYANPIIILTSDGKKVSLPFGATVIEAAGEIDPQSVPHVAGAIINRRRVDDPFIKLEHGDRVEILTDLNIEPTLEWLKFVRTDAAIRALQTALEKRSIKTIMEDAKNSLETGSQRFFFLPSRKLIKTALFIEFCDSLGYRGEREVEEFIHKIGAGQINYEDVIKNLRGYYNDKLKEAKGKWELQPCFFTLSVDDVPRTLERFAAPIGRMGVNIVPPTLVSGLKHSNRAEIIFAVNILGGIEEGGAIGHLQRLQIWHAVESLGNISPITEPKVVSDKLTEAAKKIKKGEY